MRTILQKQIPPQEQTRANRTESNTMSSGASHRTSPTPHLRRTPGNQLVQRLLHTHSEDIEVQSAHITATRFAHDFSRIPVHATVPATPQPKLTVNTPRDVYEQEADRIADHVLHVTDSQLQAEELESAQTRRVQANYAGDTAADFSISEVLRSPGRPLEPDTKAFFEPRFGFDFSRVKVHTSAQAAESAREMQSLAYTVGHNIIFAAGQYAPGTTAGKAVLAHELTHVMQQAQAPAAPRLTVSTLHSVSETRANLANRIRMPVTTDATPMALIQRKRAGATAPTATTPSTATSTETRQTLVEMVDDPAVAHKQWKQTSPSGQRAVLTAMRKRYGEDWTDEFMTRQESGLINPRFLPLGSLAPGVEELEGDGFALAAAFMLTTVSRFERWVHPDGSTAQMVREMGTEGPVEEPPSASEVLPSTQPSEDQDEEDEVMDLSPEEVRELCYPVMLGTIERVEVIQEEENGSRTIEIRTPTNIYTVQLGPDDSMNNIDVTSREEE